MLQIDHSGAGTCATSVPNQGIGRESSGESSSESPFSLLTKGHIPGKIDRLLQNILGDRNGRIEAQSRRARFSHSHDRARVQNNIGNAFGLSRPEAVSDLNRKIENGIQLSRDTLNNLRF